MEAAGIAHISGIIVQIYRFGGLNWRYHQDLLSHCGHTFWCECVFQTIFLPSETCSEDTFGDSILKCFNDDVGISDYHYTFIHINCCS